MISALLERLSFGATPDEIELASHLGPKPWIEQQLQPEDDDDPRLEQALRQAVLRISYTTGAGQRVDELRPLSALSQPVQALWPLADRKAELHHEERVRPLRELTAARLLRAAYSRWQLRELMVDFWLDHFNVAAHEVQIAVAMPAFESQCIRRHALGNFAEMLEAVASSTPMLVYLNNHSSRTGAPNENFARELLELHTLGRRRYLNALYSRWREVPGALQGQPQGYIDQDVYEAARAFTGWSVEDGRKIGADTALPATGRFRYLPSWHDPYQKRVLGQELDAFAPDMDDGRKVLALAADHPGTAEHLCEKLCRRFLGDEPPASLVASAARVWTAQRKHPQQLALVLSHILRSNEFQRALADPGAAKLKRPLELVMSLVRKLELPFMPASAGLFEEIGAAGQPLYRWPSPDGLPDANAYWLTSHGLRRRWTLALGLMENYWQTGAVTAAHLARDAQGADAVTVLEHQAARLLSPERSRAVLQRLAQAGVLPRAGVPALDAQGAGAVRRGLAWIAMSPEFQWR